MDTALLTVITPIYNCERYIARALESILMQKTTFKYKLFVVNDGSYDNSLSIIKSFEEKFKGTNCEFTVFDRPHTGLTASTWFAYRRAGTKYYCVLDADDYYIIDNKLQMAVDYMEANEDCSAFANNFYVMDEDTGEKYKFLTKTDYNAEYLPEFNMHTSSGVFRSLFTEELFEEVDSYAPGGGGGLYNYFSCEQFRNYFSYTKGYMRIDGTMGSVWSQNSGGEYTTLDSIIKRIHFADVHLFYYEWLKKYTDKDTSGILHKAWANYMYAVYEYAARLISRSICTGGEKTEAQTAKEKDDYCKMGEQLVSLAVNFAAYPQLPRLGYNDVLSQFINSGTYIETINNLKDIVDKYEKIVEKQQMVINGKL